jgi:hypothetical protein
VAVDAIPPKGWVDLFRAFAARPVLREAWAAIVTRLASAPVEPVVEALATLGLDGEPGGWREGLPRWLEAAETEIYDGRPDRLLRHATGRVMDALRGRVPAREVVEAVRATAEARR